MSRAPHQPAGQDARTAPPVADRAHCVILCAAGVAPPAVLLGALRKRGVEAILTHDPFAAMLAIVRLAPGTSNTGSEAPWPPALIVVDPSRLERASLEDLLDAAPRRAPGLVAWEYDAAARPPLRALLRKATRQGQANAASSVVVPPRGPRPAKPSLRLTDDPAPNRHEAPGRDDEPESLLSDEELSMLLADDLNDTDTR